MTDLKPRKRPTADSDPVAYANRPDSPGYDPYLTVRKHVESLHIPPRLKAAE